jgi:hypothetical protein
MATTQNTYTGNGSTVLYSFTFPYLSTADIKVSVNGVDTTAYTLASATTIQFAVAPANGAAIRIYRTTDDSQTKATFFPGSSIRAQGLNDNFLQLLYVSQETQTFAASTDASSIQAQAVTAVSIANSANTTATTALSTANAASTTANGIAATANSALTAAAAALDPADIGVTVQAFDADTAKTDVAQSFTAAQRGSITALTDGATITPDFAVANNYSVTLAGNRTLANPTNLTAGQSGCIYITQDGTSSRTLAYGSAWDFGGGTVPTLTTTAAAVDVLVYAVRTTGSIAATLIRDVK